MVYASLKTITLDSLSNKGYNVVEVKNSWNDDGNPYKGVDIKMTSPDEQKFELQFHTAESFAMKQSTHNLYEKQQKYTKGSPEWMKYENQMLEMSTTLSKPNGIESLRR